MLYQSWLSSSGSLPLPILLWQTRPPPVQRCAYCSPTIIFARVYHIPCRARRRPSLRSRQQTALTATCGFVYRTACHGGGQPPSEETFSQIPVSSSEQPSTALLLSSSIADRCPDRYLHRYPDLRRRWALFSTADHMAAHAHHQYPTIPER